MKKLNANDIESGTMLKQTLNVNHESNQISNGRSTSAAKRDKKKLDPVSNQQKNGNLKQK